ncbi:MAG: substrate-binding domain-containing protein [Clostridiaceae bacterium]|nr:substrate-binding domain-containing protein [Clostridiaceae bacterium]
METLKKPVIAICIAKVQWEPQGSMVRAICREAALNNYYVQIFNMNDDLFNGDLSENGEKAILDLITYERLCTLVVMSETIKDESVADRLIRRTNKAGIPVISVDRKHKNAYNVLFDWEPAFEELVRHVVKVHGCKRINFVGGMKNNYFSDRREAIFRKVLSEYGIPVSSDQIGYGEFWEWPARKVVQGFLVDDQELPDAIICANDLMAVTAIDVLSEHGYSVPEDVIVTGFDQIELGQYYTPRLTTASYKIKEIGQSVMKSVSIFLSGKTPHEENERVGYTCHFGESCGCMKRDYVKANKALLTVYNKYSSNINHMNIMCSMLEKMTQYNKVEELAKHLHKYIYDIRYTDLRICISEEFLQDEHAVLQKGSIDLEHMVEWIAVEYEKRFQIVRLPYHFHEQLANMQSMYEKENQVIFTPLHANDLMFGYVAVAFDWGMVNQQRLYEFVMNLNVIFSIVRKKQDTEIERKL